MIYIDYVNGLHGRFLCYVINCLDPEVRKQNLNVFTDIGTIRWIYPTPLAQADHYSAHGQYIPPEQALSILGDQKTDELLINLLYWHRINEYGFDLKNFNENFYQKICGTYLEGMSNFFILNGVDPKVVNDVPKQLLRKFFWYDNTPMLRLAQQNVNTKYSVLFRKFYDFANFIDVLNDIKSTFNITYSIDIEWCKAFWGKYMTYIIPILNEEKEAKRVLECIVNSEKTDINLNIVQEAWITNSVEKLYSINLLAVEDYYQNTSQIIKQL